jgi:cell division protein FtsN
MIEVGAYPTRSQAELEQAALAMAGIPSTLEAEDGAGEYPFDPTGAARLLDEADADAAVAVLSDHHHETRREKP